MKKLILSVFIASFSYSYAFSQEEVKFKILSFNKYSDGALLRAVDSLKGDTVNIISVSNNMRHSRDYEKIKVDSSYLISIRKLPGSQAYFDENFTIRIKYTVVWKYNDGIKNIPVIAINTNGLYILKQHPK